MQLSRIVLSIFGVLVLSASTFYAQERVTITVFAASSLTDVMENLAEAFEAQHPTIDVVFNFAGSSTLASQIEQGAVVDLFASANENQMQRIVDGGFADVSQIFAYNALALIVPLENPAMINSIDDLTREGQRLIVAAPEVPVRVYTDLILENIAASYAEPTAFVRSIRDNIISEESNVRQVLFKIELGEGDAGFVYQTDVTDNVRIVPLPSAGNILTRYPMTVMNTAPYPEEAALFSEFILSSEGQTILANSGFITPETALSAFRNLFTPLSTVLQRLINP